MINLLMIDIDELTMAVLWTNIDDTHAHDIITTNSTVVKFMTSERPTCCMHLLQRWNTQQ